MPSFVSAVQAAKFGATSRLGSRMETSSLSGPLATTDPRSGPSAAPSPRKAWQVVFRERCTTCHAFRGEGAALGPDLGSVVANGPDKLLVSILDPDREVAPNFAAWTAETKEGASVTGLLARESGSAVTLKIAGGAEEVIPRARLARLVPTGRSLMPEGLESGLTIDDIAALLAWLTAPARP